MAKSGGVTARNTRQGFRSEYIARYIFSAFGTAVEVSQGNDIGIDILCNLTSFDGLLITVKSSFGVQVKSAGSEFKYEGKQATTWLSRLEYPLLLASVDKELGRIKIYSAWNLNKYLLELNIDDETSFPDVIIFQPSTVVPFGPPLNGQIPVGDPILDFAFSDIDDPVKFEKYYKVLDEWLEFDNLNYLLRRSGISLSFGYLTWKTNIGLTEEPRVWERGTYFSTHHETRILKLLANAFIPLGLGTKNNFGTHQLEHQKNFFNDLKSFSDKYLTGHLDELGKEIFKDPL